MKNNDDGMAELLDLLKTHPELISALVFEPKNIKRLLKSKAARQLVLGVDLKAFLRHVAGPGDGGPIALCSRGTRFLLPRTIVEDEFGCERGTRIARPIARKKR
jgi:hypothetical protein